MMCYCKYTVGYRQVTGIIEADRRENKRRRSRAALGARQRSFSPSHRHIRRNLPKEKNFDDILGFTTVGRPNVAAAPPPLIFPLDIS